MRAAHPLLVLFLAAPGLVLLAGCPPPVQYQGCDEETEWFDSPSLTCQPIVNPFDAPPTCVPRPPTTFLPNPFLLWIGEAGKAPACPPDRMDSDYDGYADLTADYTCPACECKPLTGSCVLPTQITAHNASCAGNGPIATAFDAPVSWSGGCDGSNAVPAGALCAGTPCVQSVTVEPPQVVDNGCGVVVPPVPKKWLPPTWQIQARACEVDVTVDTAKVCGQRDMLVMQAPDVPPGFRICIEHKLEGEYSADCPSNRYPDAFVFYRGFTDKRGCSPCACEITQESVCSADILIYDAADCAHIGQPFPNVRSDEAPPCHDVNYGLGLLSKAALNVKYTPGVCEVSGGEPDWNIVLERPQTFCCMPASSP